MSTTLTDAPAKKRTPALNDEEERARAVLAFLTTISRRSDRELGEASGLGRERFRQRRAGEARIRRGQQQELARAFKIAPECFSMSPDELIDWLLTEKAGRDLLMTAFRCFVKYSPSARPSVLSSSRH